MPEILVLPWEIGQSHMGEIKSKFIEKKIHSVNNSFRLYMFNIRGGKYEAVGNIAQRQFSKKKILKKNCNLDRHQGVLINK